MPKAAKAANAAGLDYFEVTDAMIDAGARELLLLLDAVEPVLTETRAAQIAVEVFCSMDEARPSAD